MYIKCSRRVSGEFPGQMELPVFRWDCQRGRLEWISLPSGLVQFCVVCFYDPTPPMHLFEPKAMSHSPLGSAERKSCFLTPARPPVPNQAAEKGTKPPGAFTGEMLGWGPDGA